MKSVGIDIGSYSIKVAEVTSTRKNAVVTKFKEYILSPQPQVDKSLEIIEVLRTISNEYDLTQTRFVLAVPQHEVSVRRKSFPFRERQKIIKSLAFELEDEIPLDLQETVFEAKVLEYRGNLSVVMVCACPFESVKAHLDRAKEGHLDPHILSVDAFALSNLFENWTLPPPQAPVEIVDVEKTQIDSSSNGRVILMMGHRRSILLAYNQNSLVSMRSILWGGFDIAQNIAKIFNIPVAESYKVVQKRSYILMNSSGASKDQILLSNTITESISELSRELKFSMIELESELGLRFQQLEIMGGVSHLQNICPYLTQSLALPVNQTKAFEKIGFAFDLTPEIEASSPIAVGLAIEGLKTARNNPMNLRRGPFVKQNQNFNLFWEKWKSAVQIAAVAVLVIFIHSILRDSMSSTLEDSAEEALTKQSKTVGKTSTTLEKYLRDQQNLIKGREELAHLDHYSSAMDVLAKLTQKLPQNQKDSGLNLNLEVTKLDVDRDDLIIEGAVGNPLHIKAIESALKQIAQGEPKKIANTPALKPKTGTAFAYQLKVQRLEPQQDKK